MSNKTATIILGLILLLLQGQLWLGKSNALTVSDLKKQIAAQNNANQALALRNQRLTAEAIDLKDGTQSAEQIARSELGMARPNEIFVSIER